jgi:hypothetical protein
MPMRTICPLRSTVTLVVGASGTSTIRTADVVIRSPALSGAGLAAAAAAMLENGKRLPTAAVALSSVRRSKMPSKVIVCVPDVPE